MRMSLESYNKMNELAGKFFDANAIVDNLAYNLDFYYYNEIAKIVHLRVAHKLPEFADMVTDKMLELSARPIRTDIGGYKEEYKELPEIFAKLGETFKSLLEETRKLISIADMNEDDEVRIFCEELLVELSKYLKQAEEWANAASKMDAHTLNVHIKDYTHFIAL